MERPLVLDENTEENNESLHVSDESAAEEQERQEVTEKREEEKEKRKTPRKESPRADAIRHSVDSTYPAQGRDLTHREYMDDWEERSHRTDSFVQWDPITQRPMWAAPSAISPLPVTAYPPPACPIGHR